MPIVSPTIELAKEWLSNPSISLVKKLRGLVDVPRAFNCHRVQDKMTNVNYNLPECIIPMTHTTIDKCFMTIKDHSSDHSKSSILNHKSKKTKTDNQPKQQTLFQFFK